MGFGTFLYGEVLPGSCPDVIGDGLFFNTEVLRLGSKISNMLYLNSQIPFAETTTTILLQSFILTSAELFSSIHEN
jgi:hypothetical protein